MTAAAEAAAELRHSARQVAVSLALLKAVDPLLQRHVQQKITEEKRWRQGLWLMDNHFHARLHLDDAIAYARSAWQAPTFFKAVGDPGQESVQQIRAELQWLRRRVRNSKVLTGGQVIGPHVEGQGQPASPIGFVPEAPKPKTAAQRQQLNNEIMAVQTAFQQVFQHPMEVRESVPSGAQAFNLADPIPEPIPPAMQEVRQRLAAGVSLEADAGAMSMYLGMAGETGGVGGQAALEKMGLNKTFAWAHPRNMPRDMFQVRGSKVIQNMYGNHVDQLSKIIVDATDPSAPKTLGEVKAQIREQWPELRAYQVDRIARTETATLWTTTSVAAYQANGIDSFTSSLAEGPTIGIDSADPCDECVDAASSGPFDIDGDLPPWHPNCRCEAIPNLGGPDDPWLPPAEPWTGGGDLPVYPSGPGSGDRQMRPPDASAIAPAPELVTSPRQVDAAEAKDLFLSTVDWNPGLTEPRRFIQGALRKGSNGQWTTNVIQDPNGDLRAAIAYKEASGSIYVSDLGSDITGGGTALLRVAAQEAKAQGIGIDLVPSEAGMGFYEKLGFTDTGTGAMRLEGDALDRLAARSGEAGAATPFAAVEPAAVGGPGFTVTDLTSTAALDSLKAELTRDMGPQAPASKRLVQKLADETIDNGLDATALVLRGEGSRIRGVGAITHSDDPGAVGFPVDYLHNIVAKDAADEMDILRQTAIQAAKNGRGMMVNTEPMLDIGAKLKSQYGFQPWPEDPSQLILEPSQVRVEFGITQGELDTQLVGGKTELKEIPRMVTGNVPEFRVYNDPNSFYEMMLGQRMRTIPEVPEEEFLVKIPKHVDVHGDTFSGGVAWMHNGVAVKYETDIIDANSSTIARIRKQTNDLIDGFPEDFHNGVGDSQHVGVIEIMSGNRRASSQVGGSVMADAGKETIRFFNGNLNLDQGTFDHEMGHILGRDGGPPGSGGLLNDGPAQWMAAQRADEEFWLAKGRTYTGESYHAARFGTRWITRYPEDYAKKGNNASAVKEDWAESIEIYARSLRKKGMVIPRQAGSVFAGTPRPFEEIYPNRAKLIDEWLRGKQPEVPEPTPEIEHVGGVGEPAPPAPPAPPIGVRLQGLSPGYDLQLAKSGKHWAVKQGNVTVAKFWVDKPGELWVEVPDKFVDVMSFEFRTTEWDKTIKGYKWLKIKNTADEQYVTDMLSDIRQRQGWSLTKNTGRIPIVVTNPNVTKLRRRVRLR